MSNIDFFHSKDVPQPNDKIKIEALTAAPYPDGWRVKITLDLTPFQERPNLEIRVRSQAGRVVSEMSVIETMIRHLEFTVHIRGVESPAGEYVAEAALYYGDDATEPQHHLEIPFSVTL